MQSSLLEGNWSHTITKVHLKESELHDQSYMYPMCVLNLILILILKIHRILSTEVINSLKIQSKSLTVLEYEQIKVQ